MNTTTTINWRGREVIQRTYLFPSLRKGRESLPKYERWRKIARSVRLSKGALLRLEWMIFYHTKAEKNASLTARHFGIARKTFYTWANRFDETHIASLEEHSRAPIKRRQREYTPKQYIRFVKLRRAYIRYGKVKLLIKYQQAYPEDMSISLWNIQCMLIRSGIYYHPVKQARINRKRGRAVQTKRIADLKKKEVRGFLVCLDTIVQYWNGKKWVGRRS